jgi:hypothetical protein
VVGPQIVRRRQAPGFPVVIFGGEHADVPLEETAGATSRRVIVEKRSRRSSTAG